MTRLGTKTHVFLKTITVSWVLDGVETPENYRLYQIISAHWEVEGCIYLAKHCCSGYISDYCQLHCPPVMGRRLCWTSCVEALHNGNTLNSNLSATSGGIVLILWQSVSLSFSSRSLILRLGTVLSSCLPHDTEDTKASIWGHLSTEASRDNTYSVWKMLCT